MVDAAVKIEGLKELRKGLKAVDGDLAKELTKAQREIAKTIAMESRGAAGGLGGAARHFAGKITGKATAAGGRIEVAPVANAAFWGAFRRTGWNAGHGGRPQHRPWVGSGWEPGGSGGPYAINPTIAKNLPDIEDKFLEAVQKATKQAFPTGGSS